MDKVELRNRILTARRSISPDDLSAWNARIKEHLEAFPSFAESDCVLSYVNSKDNEVETRPTILNALGFGKKVLVPNCTANACMEWRSIGSLDDLCINRFGIFEASENNPIAEVPDHSVCLVPGIVFSSNGHRIGYGGGYFDRFLSGFKGKSIGLAFEIQLSDDWVPDAHDVAVDFMVTECGVRKCR